MPKPRFDVRRIDAEGGLQDYLETVQCVALEEEGVVESSHADGEASLEAATSIDLL